MQIPEGCALLVGTPLVEAASVVTECYFTVVHFTVVAPECVRRAP